MRPPEVFVRELSPDEGSRLKSISRKAKYQAERDETVRTSVCEAAATC